MQRRTAQGSRGIDDRLSCEGSLALHYSGAPSWALMLATPCDLEDLALGLSSREGLVGNAGELHIPRPCPVAYYPETNPPVPRDSLAERARTPASKAIRVVLLPRDAAGETHPRDIPAALTD